MWKRRKWYSDNFNRDWDFYLRVLEDKTIHLINLPNQVLHKFSYDINWLSAKDCFFKYDSWQWAKPTKELELLKDIFKAKSNVNFWINQWIETPQFIFPAEIKAECENNNFPSRVYKAFEQGMIKRFNKDTKYRNRIKDTMEWYLTF